MPEYLSQQFIAGQGYTFGSSIDGVELEPLFTDEDLIRAYLGSEAVDALLDDISGAENRANELLRAIVEAGDMILSRALQRYTAIGLARSSWVQRRATELACLYLFQRRGQAGPEGLVDTVQRVIDELDRLADAKTVIIPGAVPREEAAPSISNYVVDQKILGDQLRVNPSNSNNHYPGRKDSGRVFNPFDNR